MNHWFTCEEEKGTVNLQMNKTYFIISKSFGSETLIFRAIFHERWTMGTMDFTLCSLFHSYRSTANLYWQAAQTHSHRGNQAGEGTISNQDHAVHKNNLCLLQLNFIHNEPFIPATFPFFKMSFKKCIYDAERIHSRNKYLWRQVTDKCSISLLNMEHYFKNGELVNFQISQIKKKSMFEMSVSHSIQFIMILHCYGI